MSAKVGVVGAGAVGQACAYALLLRGSVSEIVLIDSAAEKAAAVAADMRYGDPLAPPVAIAAGDWHDLEGADVVLICAGVNEKDGGATDRADERGRLRLLATNAEVYRDVVPRILDAAPDAVLVAVTDPPDPLADLARTLAGHDRVLSTGTVIDTLRFRVHLAAELGVDPASVHGLVLGEHGTSEVLLWSSVRISGTCARITEAIMGDERVVLPVAAYRERYGATIGLPTVLGRKGALHELEPHMDEDEREALELSAAEVRSAARSIGVTTPGE